MFLFTFPSGLFETNAYVVGCEKTGQSILIDPAQGALENVISCLEENRLTLCGIWLTHSHWDHLGDVASCKETFGVPVCVHESDRENLETPGSDGVPCPIAYQSILPDRFFVDGEKLHLGNLAFLVLHTPGHTPGSVCFYCKEEGVLFTGDTLFQGGFGNLSFPTAEPEKMKLSLKRLSHLPAETRVYPGHGAMTTIGKERWLADAERFF